MRCTGQLPGQDTAAINAHARYLHRHGITVWALTCSVDSAYVVPEHAAVVDNVTPNDFATLAAALEDTHGSPR